jgi:hypothetical protein
LADGDIHGNKSVYFEVDVVPFRLGLEVLTPGDTYTIHREAHACG